MSVFERLGFGFTFADLNGRDGLIRLDKQFLEALALAIPASTIACLPPAPPPTA